MELNLIDDEIEPLKSLFLPELVENISKFL